jgi:dTDP-4-amino-4,6-dideoxygalactose transaminase
LQGYTNTEKIHNSAVSIPCYPALTDLEIEQICEAIITVGTTCSAAH